MKEYTDTVIAAVNDTGEATLRLADWTPNGGYEALTEAAMQAGVDLDSLEDGEKVGLATVTEDGSVDSFTAERTCDHTDGRRLGTHPDGSDPWPVVFEEEPKGGYTVEVRCMDCGEGVTVVYRMEEIIESDGETIWERD